MSPAANEEACRVRLDSGETRGLVACIGEGPDATIVGWIKVTPLHQVAKLRSLPVYRRFAFEEGAHGVACSLVDPTHRRHGVFRRLVAAAADFARSAGATSLYAFPRRASEPVAAEELWLGIDAVYADDGYVQVGGESQYPILRKDLAIRPRGSSTPAT